jgi:hypothetical protein
MSRPISATHQDNGPAFNPVHIVVEDQRRRFLSQGDFT